MPAEPDLERDRLLFEAREGAEPSDPEIEDPQRRFGRRGLERGPFGIVIRRHAMKRGQRVVVVTNRLGALAERERCAGTEHERLAMIGCAGEEPIEGRARARRLAGVEEQQAACEVHAGIAGRQPLGPRKILLALPVAAHLPEQLGASQPEGRVPRRMIHGGGEIVDLLTGVVVRASPARGQSEGEQRRQQQARKRSDEGRWRVHAGIRLPHARATGYDSAACNLNGTFPMEPLLEADPPMRKPTSADAELMLRLYEVRRDPELRRARQWFLTEFRPAGWAEIKARYLSHSDEDRWFRMTISYWEMVATIVNRGALHPELFYDHTGEDVVTWERCKVWIQEARADIRPTYLYQFERLVAGHLAFRVKANAAFAAAGARKAARPSGRKRAR